MSRFQEGNVYNAMGPYALLVCVTIAAIERRRLWEALKPRGAAVGLGIGAGVVMTLLTYPVFDLATTWFPALDNEVHGLYAQSRQGSPWMRLLSVPVIIVAEELLWRQLAMSALRPPWGVYGASAASVLLYVGAQLGSGSFIVGALALCCGALWTWLRLSSASLLVPLLAHAIWTPIVIFLAPLV